MNTQWFEAQTEEEVSLLCGDLSYKELISKIKNGNKMTPAAADHLLKMDMDCVFSKLQKLPDGYAEKFISKYPFLKYFSHKRFEPTTSASARSTTTSADARSTTSAGIASSKEDYLKNITTQTNKSHNEWFFNLSDEEINSIDPSFLGFYLSNSYNVSSVLKDLSRIKADIIDFRYGPCILLNQAFINGEFDLFEKYYMKFNYHSAKSLRDSTGSIIRMPLEEAHLLPPIIKRDGNIFGLNEEGNFVSLFSGKIYLREKEPYVHPHIPTNLVYAYYGKTESHPLMGMTPICRDYGSITCSIPDRETGSSKGETGSSKGEKFIDDFVGEILVVYCPHQLGHFERVDDKIIYYRNKGVGYIDLDHRGETHLKIDGVKEVIVVDV